MNPEVIWNILESAISLWASDIHITEWKEINFRINWELTQYKDLWVIESELVRKILIELLNWKKETITKFLEQNDLDFAYIYKNWTSFRVNAFYILWKIAFVLRRIANEVMDMKSLLMPPWVANFTKMKQWLILITWPTGSGKSTSMVSILDTINQERWEHILTIEDPIEFVFTDKKSIFSQREIWRDTKSFKAALKAALREDPNIVMIWELRDFETVESALELAETWHLVISTLHTWGAVQTVNRILSFFPLEWQNLVREKLSLTLKWVLSQRLVPRIGWWRVWIYELLLADIWVKNLIRNWKIEQLQSLIETWSQYWMITMQKYCEKLRDHWIIKEEDYINFFTEE